MASPQEEVRLQLAAPDAEGVMPDSAAAAALLTRLDGVRRMALTTKAIAGVRSVQNNVTLKTAPTSVGTKVDDSIVTTRVKTALLADISIKSFDIAVVTRNGDVAPLEPHGHDAIATRVLREVGRNGFPAITTIARAEHLVGRREDHLRVVGRVDERRVPVPAVRRVAGRRLRPALVRAKA
jgi:hypothetical protein